MKMGRLSTLALLLLAVLLVSPLSVQAEPDEVYIKVWFNPANEYAVRPDQTVILYGRWGACSPGLVRMFRTASDVELTLDEAPLLGPEEVRELWGEPGSPEPCEFCMGGQDLLWSYWYHSLGTLEPGTHVLVTTVTLNHRVHDGADWELDGSPDSYPAGHWFDKEIKIIVQE
jgi:hypothetical protein